MAKPEYLFDFQINVQEAVFELGTIMHEVVLTIWLIC